MATKTNEQRCNKLAEIGEGHEVWYSKQAVTNILSLKFVGEIYHVTYDSNDGSFVVHRDQHGMPDLVLGCITAVYTSLTREEMILHL